MAGFNAPYSRNRLKHMNIRGTCPPTPITDGDGPAPLDPHIEREPAREQIPRRRVFRGWPGAARAPGATPIRPRYSVTSSTCGTEGVTRGPAGAHTMFTSLRTPNSPGR